MSGPLYDEALAKLIARAMETLDSGGLPNYAEICTGHEHLIDAVRQSCDYADELRLAHEDPEAPPIREERTIADRYQLEERLGSGAMGVVYRARDAELDRFVAVKVMRAFVLAKKEARARFERESQALASVRHPSVVTVHDRGVTDSGEPFLVMDLLDGVSVGDLLAVAERRGDRVHDASTAWIAAAIGGPPLPEHNFLRAAVRWIAECAEGLHAAHLVSIVHRDVKPSNIFLKADGSAVLVDFGIAAQLDAETITRDGGPLGTPAYMAPESLDAERAATSAVDIYGLCATLYHFLVLRPPFRGTPSQALSALSRRDPTPVRRLRNGLPRDLVAILEQGMAKDPLDRYADAQELARDLRRFLEHQPVAARPVGATQRAWRRLRRSTVARTLVASVATMAAAIGVSSWMEERSENRISSAIHAIARLTPQLTLQRFDNRRAVLRDERTETRLLLDELIDTCAVEPWGRIVRAMFRFDQADRVGCVRDLELAANTMATDYARAVAAGYAELPTTIDAGAQVDFALLPPPATPEDHLLAGYLRLRIRDFEGARIRLAHELLATSQPAEILRLLILQHDIEAARDRAERDDLSANLEKRARHIESRIGQPIAWTRHQLSYALAVQRNYTSAAEVAEHALELAPYASGTAMNAAHSWRRIGRHSDALRVLEQGRRIRPNDHKPYWNIIYTLLEMGEREQAEHVWNEAAFGQDGLEVWRRQSLYGVILTERAWAKMESNAEAESRELAARAHTAFEQAQQVQPVKARKHWALARTLAESRHRDAFSIYLGLIATRSLDAATLHALATNMPADLNTSETEALRAYFRRQASRAKPGVPLRPTEPR